MSTPEPFELYAIPFSCSFAAHLALKEAGLPYRVRWVTRGAGRLEDGSDFKTVNPKGKVAALRLPGGDLVTENVAVLLHLAEAGPPGLLAPPLGTREWLRAVEWLTFVSTELHKQVLAPSFDPATPEQTRQDVLTRLLPVVLGHLERRLAAVSWLVGDAPGPSVADAYLIWATILVKQLGVSFEPYPALSDFRRRMFARPAVEAVLSLEREALARTGDAR